MENLTLNRVSLEELATKLNEWETRKKDIVVPSRQIEMIDGNIHFTTNPSVYTPTDHMSGQISSKLNIPRKYYDRMKTDNMALLDTNVTSWLRKFETSYLLRLYESQNESEGIGRALLSNVYRSIDNGNILMTVLQGIKDRGISVSVENCSLSETKMYVRFVSDIKIDSPELLKDYRDPGSGNNGTAIAAGLILSNSEVGAGSFYLAPYIKFLVCSNGQTINKEAIKRHHVGGKLDEGEINWSNQTIMANKRLIQSMVKDYFDSYVNVSYLTEFVNQYKEQAGQQILYPQEVITGIGEKINLNEKDQNDILNYFIKGGQTSVMGIANSVTYLAHETESPDKQFELESSFDWILNNAKEFDKRS